MPLEKLGAGGRQQLGATAAAQLSPSPGLTPVLSPDANGYVTVPATVTIPASIAATPSTATDDAAPIRSGAVAAAAANWPPGGKPSSRDTITLSRAPSMPSPGRVRRSRAVSEGDLLGSPAKVSSPKPRSSAPRSPRGRASPEQLIAEALAAEDPYAAAAAKARGEDVPNNGRHPSAVSEGGLRDLKAPGAKVITPMAKAPVPNGHHPKGIALAWLEAQPKMSFPRESGDEDARADQDKASSEYRASEYSDPRSPANTAPPQSKSIRRHQALPSGLRTTSPRISEGADGEWFMYASLGKRHSSRSGAGTLLSRQQQRRTPSPGLSGTFCGD